MDVEQETEGANTVSEAEGFHYCDVEVPVSSEHPDRKCSHKFQITSGTTSNLITHLCTNHNISKPAEEQKVNYK
ncbi:hypothetical protein F8M41_001202 [Gigaspora margarita]|uniref:BED-type domain-containing protein n=1 Tax=Gigaspora margarita TaxID=4874 RepID=A0A8H3XH83_GIGMA|nr:hypothetical protein F8M41_001202 [Gigaspora margarita]